MSYTKKNMVSDLIKIDKLFEKNISKFQSENINSLDGILNRIFDDELTIYKKKVLNDIIEFKSNE
jgi:hypothetical protein